MNPLHHPLLSLSLSIAFSTLPSAVFSRDTSPPSTVCTPQLCLNGTNALLTGATVKSDPVLKLLPGTYSLINGSSSTPINSSISLQSLSSASANPGFEISRSGSSLLVSQSASLLTYTDPMFQGIPTISNLSLAKSRSFLLADGFQLHLQNPSRTIYDSCPDLDQWPSSSSSNLDVLSLESASCDHGCGAGGICGTNGTCVCSNGFTGPRCDTCAPGFYGSQCQPCSQCSFPMRCEDGVIGSGICSPANITRTNTLPPAALKKCNCINGYCISDTSCFCSAGWVSASNGTLCAACGPGFFQDPTGNCLACAPGCLSCASQTGVCDTCISGLRVSSKDPHTCEQAPFNLVGSSATGQNTCDDGRYSANGTACLSCSSTCKTCFGPTAGDCLQCAGTRALLIVGITSKKDGERGSCVDVDQSTGVCQSVSGLYLYDSSKGICEPAPRLCKAASIPGFTFGSSQTPNSPVCSSCETGAFLNPNAPQGARCVGVCPDGTYDNGQGVCASCPNGCATCRADGNSASCTSCSDQSQALDGGKCVSGGCKAGQFSNKLSTDESFGLQGTTVCLPCASSCATCDGGPTTCLSCPKGRPAYDPTTKTCAASCPRGFFVGKDGRCSGCDPSCATCSASGSGNCLSCPLGSNLSRGKCTPGHCSDNAAVIGPWGVCLESLLDITTRSNTNGDTTKKIPIWIILIICVVLLILLIAMALIIWRWRAVKKREDRTNEFGNGFYTRATDIKLKELGLRPPSISSRSGSSHLHRPRSLQASTIGPMSTLSYPSLRSGTSTSSFNIKRKSVPSILPPLTDRGSVYSQPDEFPSHLRPPVTIPMRSESGSIWFESGVRPPRVPEDDLDLDPEYHGPY